MARKVDVNLLAELNDGAANQEVKRTSFSKTSDPKFPVFQTPVNRNILVYIPKTNVVVTENGEEMKLLTTYAHTYRDGQYTSMMRCISGLEGGAFSNVLGYDGTCPACEATKECWELYNRRLSAEAKQYGIDPQNDKADVLKGARQKILSEMDMKGSEEYVTFPIVIIPTIDGTDFEPAPSPEKNLQVQFVVWTKKRYDKNILGALDSIEGRNNGHPGGLFWFWKFTYDTQGKPANARDSAKNASYVVCTRTKLLEQFGTPAGRAFLEKTAAEFTNTKAVEVIYSNQFLYKTDMDEKVNKVMAKTRSLLAATEISPLGVAAPSTSTASGQLSAFGTAGGSAFGTGQALPGTMGLEGQVPVKFGE